MSAIKKVSDNKDEQLSYLDEKEFKFFFQSEEFDFQVSVEKNEIVKISSKNYSSQFSTINGSSELFKDQYLDPFDLKEPTALVEFLIQVAQTLNLKTLICKEAIKSIHPNSSVLLRHVYFLLYGRSWLKTLSFENSKEGNFEAKLRESKVREGSIFDRIKSYQEKENNEDVISNFEKLDLVKTTGEGDINNQSIAYVIENLWKKKEWDLIQKLIDLLIPYIFTSLEPGFYDKLIKTNKVKYSCDITERIFYDPKFDKITLSKIQESNLSPREKLSSLSIFQKDGTFQQWIIPISQENKEYELPVLIKQSTTTYEIKYKIIVYSDKPTRLDANPFRDVSRKKRGACVVQDITFNVLNGNFNTAYLASINNYSKCANPYLQTKGGGKLMVNFILNFLVALKVPFTKIIDAASPKTLNFDIALFQLGLTKTGFAYYENFGFVPNPLFYTNTIPDGLLIRDESLGGLNELFEILKELKRIRNEIDNPKPTISPATGKFPSFFSDRPDSDSEFDSESVTSGDNDIKELEQKENELFVQRDDVIAKLSNFDQILIWLPSWSKIFLNYRKEFVKDLQTKSFFDWLNENNEKDPKRKIEKLLKWPLETPYDDKEELDLESDPELETFGDIFTENIDELIKKPLSFWIDTIVQHNQSEDENRAKIFLDFINDAFYIKSGYLAKEIIYLGDRFSFDRNKFIQENSSTNFLPLNTLNNVCEKRKIDFIKQIRLKGGVAFPIKGRGIDFYARAIGTKNQKLDIYGFLSFDLYNKEVLVDFNSRIPPFAFSDRESEEIGRDNLSAIAISIIKDIAQCLDFKEIKIENLISKNNLPINEYLRLLRKGISEFEEAGAIIDPCSIKSYPQGFFNNNLSIELYLQYQKNGDKDVQKQLNESMKKLVETVTIEDILDDKPTIVNNTTWSKFINIKEFKDAIENLKRNNIEQKTLKQLADVLEKEDNSEIFAIIMDKIFYFATKRDYILRFERPKTNLIIQNKIKFIVPLFN